MEEQSFFADINKKNHTLPENADEVFFVRGRLPLLHLNWPSSCNGGFFYCQDLEGDPWVQRRKTGCPDGRK